MPWLKRNLLLVVGGVIALGLLGFAGYFLYGKIQQESEVTQQLAEQTTALEDLAKKDPHPGSEKVNNIDAAKKQEQELKNWLTEARKMFAPPAYPQGLDGGQFKLLLDNTLSELKLAADRAGVKLPADYAFTFAPQRTLMFFEPPTIPPLSMALMDIKAISMILFEAKVLTLDGIRRSAIASQDQANASTGASEYWTKKAFTNDLAIVVPYEFTFHAFTAELSAVLEKLYSVPHCFIVKNVVSDPTPSTLMEKTETPEAAQGPLMAPVPGMTMSQMMMMMRYGRRGRYGLPSAVEAAPPPVAVAAPKAGLSPMLDEKPLRIILWVDVVRLKEPGKEGRPSVRARAPRPAPVPGDTAAPAPADTTAPAPGDAGAAAPPN
jgi:hypothetical protein